MSNAHTAGALNLLTAKQRAVLVLARRDGMSYQQIADALHIGVSDVRDQMAAALLQLVRADEARRHRWRTLIARWVNRS